MIKFAPPLLVVTVALMAPWPPARMTLTTAGLVWRLQCLIWGMMTTRMSMMRTMMKTNPSTPRHSNKHSPSNPPSPWEFSPLFVCASSTFSPVSHACISVWLSQGCRWILKEQRCILHPSFFCSWITCTCTTALGEVSSKGTVVCGPATTLKSLYV